MSDSEPRPLIKQLPECALWLAALAGGLDPYTELQVERWLRGKYTARARA